MTQIAGQEGSTKFPPKRLFGPCLSQGFAFLQAVNFNSRLLNRPKILILDVNDRYKLWICIDAEGHRARRATANRREAEDEEKSHAKAHRRKEGER